MLTRVARPELPARGKTVCGAYPEWRLNNKNCRPIHATDRQSMSRCRGSCSYLAGISEWEASSGIRPARGHHGDMRISANACPISAGSLDSDIQDLPAPVMVFFSLHQSTRE